MAPDGDRQRGSTWRRNDRGEPDENYTDQGHRNFTLSAGRKVITIRVGIDIFGFPPKRLEVEAGAGDVIDIRFEANDLGRESFDRAPARWPKGSNSNDGLQRWVYERRVVGED